MHIRVLYNGNIQLALDSPYKAYNGLTAGEMKSPNTNAFDGPAQGSRCSGFQLCQGTSLARIANNHFEMTYYIFDRSSSSHTHPLAIESFPLSGRLKTAYCSDGPSFKNLSKGPSPREILEFPAIPRMDMW
jgi:hypothetical protein